MELRILPLFTADSDDDATIEEQLKWVGKVYNFYKFSVVFWPYRTRNSNNTIPLKDLFGPHSGEVMDLWGGAAQLYGGQMSYILPVVFAPFRTNRIAGLTSFVAQKSRRFGMLGNLTADTKPICTVNTRKCTVLTTAHEIGHAAGLEDQEVDNRNLMFHSGERLSYGLDVDQRNRIAKSGFAH
ncbi:MAG TPA: hypothetical protein VIS96_02495 [Terrimicrobiaceae bacterium]